MTVTGDLIGLSAARMMERLEKEFEEDKTAEVQHVAVIVGLKTSLDHDQDPPVEIEDSTISHVIVETNGISWYETIGLLHGGLQSIGSD